MRAGKTPPRLFGHPWHAALVHFPMALLALPLPLDVAAWLTGDATWWIGSRACIGLGLAAALLAGLAGLVDFSALRDNAAAERTAIRHLLVMLTAIAVFAVDGWLRLETAAPTGASRIAAVGLSALGLGCLIFGGWLGGELVYRHRVGQVDEGS